MNTIKRTLLAILGAFILNQPLQAGEMEDDPILFKVMGEVAVHDSDGDKPRTWDIEGWIGRDLDKFWFKTSGEQVAGDIENASVQLGYARAISPFWDLQLGIKHDITPAPKRTWAVVGFSGLAPYLIETDAAIHIDAAGRSALSLSAEYEYMLSQTVALSSEIELMAYGKDDEATGAGAGLSSVEAGIHLIWEMSREFAPFVGISWEKSYGNSAMFAHDSGEDIENAALVSGIRFWF